MAFLATFPAWLFVVQESQAELLAQFGFARSPVSLAGFAVVMLLSYATGGAFLVHAFHQPRTVSRIYRDHVEVDPVDLGPLYAFSGLTAASAVGLQIQADLWIVTNPTLLNEFIPVASVLVATIISAIVFTLPLWGVHHQILREKARRLAENGRHRESLIRELQRGVDAGDLGQATVIRDAVLALEVEQRTLAQVRTWPWEPEALQLLVTAVLVPTAVFVLQFGLQRVLVRALTGS